ncbi:hypothetical protein TNCV_791711 [Trichonephila clavipes]|nr:hypothetical protein TNCV_791711 [Trichonephila clavipes]
MGDRSGDIAREVKNHIPRSIKEGQNKTCNVFFYIILLEDCIWQALKIAITTEPYCGSLNHHTSKIAPMLMSNASRRLVVSSTPSDIYTAIRLTQAKPGLLWKDGSVILLYPALSFGPPE